MSGLTKFGLVLALQIPAIFFSIVIFTYFALNRQVCSKIKNQGWLILLIVNFFQLTIDLPMPMSYYYLQTVWSRTNAYCVWWAWYEYSINTVGLFLMAWISIERHLFIFHWQAIFEVSWKKWVFHIIPITLCLIWTPIFYLVILVINPFCTNVWDFNFVNCGTPCYFNVHFLAEFDFICNIVFPVMIIMLANVTLIIRVIHRKISRRQAINWRRHRKMVLQLWIVSSLYMAFWLPTTITELIQITVMPSFMIDQLETIFFIVYFIPLLLPIICLSVLPELVKKIVDIIWKPRLNIIGAVGFIRGTGQAMPIVTIR